MTEAFPDSAAHAGNMDRIHRPWYRRIWFLILVVLLGVGLVSLIVLFPDANARTLRRRDRQMAGRVRVTKASLRQLHTAVNQFHMDTGRWPTQAEGLSVLVIPPAGVTSWPPGGYLETPAVPQDAWGRGLIYQLQPSADKPFVIKSLGADGVEGGEGYDADLRSTDFN